MRDQYSANALKLNSTGHALGGPNSLPSVSSHCLCLKGGEEPLEKLLTRTAETQGNFLYVHRYSGQTDPVTGDFSGVAKGGEWWQQGERVYYVQETMISGNLFEALQEDLFGLSRETEVVESSEECPTLVLDQVSVTSGAKGSPN